MQDKIFLIDLDGTLVETDTANFKSYEQAIEEVFGQSFFNGMQTGRFTRDSLVKVFPKITQEEYRLIIDKKEKYYSNYLSHIEINKNLLRFIQKNRKNNRVFLTTNAREYRAKAILNYYGIRDLFEACVCRNNQEIFFNKYQTAVTMFNLDVEKIHVFENEESEILKAIHTGISKDNIHYLRDIYAKIYC